jgi:dihydrofolate reductase
MRLTLQSFLTVDGVMQAPGGPEEDATGGFAFGGWSFPYTDEEFARTTMVGWFANASAFLLGRRTYEIFSGFWPNVTGPDNPIADALNRLPKYVASTTLQSVTWSGSSLLVGDLPTAVARLKEEPGNELQVHGSGELAQTLIEHDLVDEYRLFIYPVHLGAGRKLFREGTRHGALKLVSSETTSSGVVVASYVPDGPVRTGSFAERA